jgi:Ca2+-binding RTX toxin-like protein
LANVEAISAGAESAGVAVTLAGQTEGFTLSGGAFADSLTGGAGADAISAGSGDDTIYGFVGADTIDGGAGADTLVLAATSTDLNAAAMSDARLVGLEAISASGATAGVTIALTAQTEGFSITGGAFADSLTGGAGADNINAGSGDDTIYGFVNADTIDGGVGADTLFLAATSADLNSAADGQLSAVEAISASTAAAGVIINLASQTEGFSITGGAFADSLTGGAGADSISAGSGDDAIYGLCDLVCGNIERRYEKIAAERAAFTSTVS